MLINVASYVFDNSEHIMLLVLHIIPYSKFILIVYSQAIIYYYGIIPTLIYYSLRF